MNDEPVELMGIIYWSYRDHFGNLQKGSNKIKSYYHALKMVETLNNFFGEGSHWCVKGNMTYDEYNSITQI